MTSSDYRWPHTGRDCPQDIAKHASCLKTDFDLVSKTVDISLTLSEKLPSTLKSSVLTGIKKGIAEARNNGNCPKWSKVDERIFRELMLKNITIEAAPRARDRIPLKQFNGVHKSYKALHTKLVAQLPPTATSHQSVGDAAPVQATSVGGLVEPSHKTNTATELVRAPESTVTNLQEKKGKDVTERKSDDNSSEEGNRGEAKSEDKESGDKERKEEERCSQEAQDGQTVTNSKDTESGSDSSEDSSNDSSSGSKEENEAQRYTDCEEAGNQDIYKDGTGFSATFNIQIAHQASVNQMYCMKGSEMMECSSSLLKSFLHKQQLSSRNVRIYNCGLMPDHGDVRVIVHAETREVLQQLMDLGPWHQGFEETLTCPPRPTYKVIMHKVEKSSMRLESRLDKSSTIEELELANCAIDDQNGNKVIITNVSWAPQSLNRTASLLVELQDSKHANHAVAHGLFWRGMRLGCERADKEGRLFRCSGCQAYGHYVSKCTAPYRCGKCGKEHSTKTCKSKIAKCASCGGGHRAGNKRCPEKVSAKKNLEFKNEDTSQATKPATEADRTPPSDVQRSITAGRYQTEASMPSPVSLDAESAEDDVESGSKQPLPEVEPAHDDVKSQSKQPLPEVETPQDDVESQSKQPFPEVETPQDDVEFQSKQSLPQADSPQDTSMELATLRQEFEDIKKKFVALDTILQSKVSGGTKRRADESFVNGAGAESSDVAAKRIKKEEPTREDCMGLYRQPSLYSEDRAQ